MQVIKCSLFHSLAAVITETGRDGRQKLLSDGNQTDRGEIHRDAGLHRESEGSLELHSQAYCYIIALMQFMRSAKCLLDVI